MALAVALAATFSVAIPVEVAATTVSQATRQCEETVSALRGRVGFVPDGEVPGVGFRVALYTHDWKRIVRQTRTGPDGSFDLGFIAPGTHNIRYWKRGFMGARAVICLDPTSAEVLLLKTEALR